MTENPRDPWETPQWLFGWCVRKYGSFDVDAAAGHHNAKCKKFWTREDDALTQDWSGLAVFANVPFCGGNDIAAWLHKGMDAYKAIYVLPVRTALISFRRKTSRHHQILRELASWRWMRA
jgi:phage N-6-adenine-methyltransferase